MHSMKKLTSKRALLALAAALALTAPLSAGAQTSGEASRIAAAGLTPLAGAERTQAIGQINTALNAVQRMQGRFVQTSPDGSRAAGAFYLQKPGKLRFEYDPPATMLIVSDGSVVSLRDTALRTTDRTPLRSTPLNLILGANINLERDARIQRVLRQGEWTIVTARDRTGETDGIITLHFFGPTSELRSWDVIDASGARTRTTLSAITQPASLNRNLFRLEDVLETRPRRPT